jgi:hypothetical protein
LHIDISDDNIFMWIDHVPSLPGLNLQNAITIARQSLNIMGHPKPGERFDVEIITRQHTTSVTSLREALKEHTLEAGCLTNFEIH